MLSAMALCFTASLAMADEVMYCADTGVVGFRWDDTGKVDIGKFPQDRYTVKVISNTERVITQMTGDTAGNGHPYTCRALGVVKDQIVCDEELQSGAPWIFYKNNYTHAFLQGTPVGPPPMDPNISVAYGTCARF
jgi:hypothetical protein